LKQTYYKNLVHQVGWY